MKGKINTRLGCLSAVVFLVLLTVVISLLRGNKNRWQETEMQAVPWAQAVEMCKMKYKSLASPGVIKVPNCRKRTENDAEHVFSWSRPVGIYIKKDGGGVTTNKGTCVVSKETGEIVYMTLNKKVIVGEKKK